MVAVSLKKKNEDKEKEKRNEMRTKKTNADQADGNNRDRKIRV